jgi:hypothetical protein
MRVPTVDPTGWLLADGSRVGPWYNADNGKMKRSTDAQRLYSLATEYGCGRVSVRLGARERRVFDTREEADAYICDNATPDPTGLEIGGHVVGEWQPSSGLHASYERPGFVDGDQWCFIQDDMMASCEGMPMTDFDTLVEAKRACDIALCALWAAEQK